MAIAVDSTSLNNQGTTGASLTWSHTCTGTNLMLVVTVSLSASAANCRATGVTYNGVAMTKGVESSGATTDAKQSVWYLSNPDTGAHDVVVSLANNNLVTASSISFTGTDGVGGSNSNGGGSTAFSTVAVTTTGTNGIIVDAHGDSSSTTPPSSDSSTLHSVTRSNNGHASGYKTFVSGNQTRTWSISPNGYWEIAALEIKAAASAVVKKVSHNLTLLGAG